MVRRRAEILLLLDIMIYLQEGDMKLPLCCFRDLGVLIWQITSGVLFSSLSFSSSPGFQSLGLARAFSNASQGLLGGLARRGSRAMETSSCHGHEAKS